MKDNILKKELGMPFSEYLIGKRIQKAKELLLDDKLSIEEVAEKVGYNDYFYFLKSFKKNTGIHQVNTEKVWLKKYYQIRNIIPYVIFNNHCTIYL